MPPKIIYRLSRLDQLISNMNTGTPSELSKKMKVSERCVRNYITILKSLGAPIQYSNASKSYFYKSKGYFNFGFIKSDSNEN